MIIPDARLNSGIILHEADGRGQVRKLQEGLVLALKHQDLFNSTQTSS